MLCSGWLLLEAARETPSHASLLASGSCQVSAAKNLDVPWPIDTSRYFYLHPHVTSSVSLCPLLFL